MNVCGVLGKWTEKELTKLWIALGVKEQKRE